jgi:catechol 2,3-dioxygenase-like lactoylglutathione lyase family enzyme
VIESMNHFTVLTDDLERTLAFYVDGLGFEVGPRPPFDFPGAWLYAGGRPILHIMAGRRLPEPRSGVLDHMAFSARDLRGVKAALERMGVPYDLRRLVGGEQWQLFCHDPSGAKVELDFEGAEAP